MNTRLKATIETTIQKGLDAHCEDGDCWTHYIHPELVRQMTDAAEVVFDASQAAQEYYARENE